MKNKNISKTNKYTIKTIKIIKKNPKKNNLLQLPTTLSEY